MNKEEIYNSKDINAEIESLDRVGVQLFALSRKYERGTIENQTLLSYFNQNLENIHKLQEKLKRCESWKNVAETANGTNMNSLRRLCLHQWRKRILRKLHRF